jgi:N-ethylmaleimide reductase
MNETIETVDTVPQQPTLLTPVRVGPYTLRNRMAMAPMTRSRAVEGNVPSPLAPAYYRQRASAGLIISEGSQISPEGVGYPGTPGIHTDEQVAGWRQVTEAVHAAEGRIFLQLWHVGRVSHPYFQQGGALPVAPSAIAIQGSARTPEGPKPFVAPRALELAEIPRRVEDFAAGARRALAAGFDGVEIHGANGYLIDEFLRDGSNRRTDVYGGPVEQRARFLLEVTEAVTGVWGADRVGVRLSPMNPNNDMSDSDKIGTFGYAAQALDRFGLAYLHVMTPGSWDPATESRAVLQAMRERFRGPLMVNGGFTRETGDALLAAGLADLISFGVLFLANPDLPERFAEGAPLNEPDRATFYGGGERGYIDYPTRAAVVAAV